MVENMLFLALVFPFKKFRASLADVSIILQVFFTNNAFSHARNRIKFYINHKEKINVFYFVSKFFLRDI